MLKQKYVPYLLSPLTLPSLSLFIRPRLRRQYHHQPSASNRRPLGPSDASPKLRANCIFAIKLLSLLFLSVAPLFFFLLLLLRRRHHHHHHHHQPFAFILPPPELRDSFDFWGTPEGDLVHPADCMHQLFEKVREHRVNIDGNVCTVMVTILVLEGWQRKLDPDYDVMHTLQTLLLKSDWAQSLSYTIEGLMAP